MNKDKQSKIEELKEFIKDYVAWDNEDMLLCDVPRLKTLILQTIEQEREKAWNAGRESTVADAGWEQIINHPTYPEFSHWQQNNKIEL